MFSSAEPVMMYKDQVMRNRKKKGIRFNADWFIGKKKDPLLIH